MMSRSPKSYFLDVTKNRDTHIKIKIALNHKHKTVERTNIR